MRLYEQAKAKLTASLPGIGANRAFPTAFRFSGDPTVKAVLAYLDQRGYQMMSYERIRQRIGPHLTDDALDLLVRNNPKVLRHAALKGGKRGLAKLIP
jgi:hypothetical protein